MIPVKYQVAVEVQIVGTGVRHRYRSFVLPISGPLQPVGERGFLWTGDSDWADTLSETAVRTYVYLPEMECSYEQTLTGVADADEKDLVEYLLASGFTEKTK